MESHQAEQVHRPLVFDKMENLVREMQDPESGVPVRSQKLFLTSIPSAFMGYDLIEWLMERLGIEDSVEAVHMANLLCQYGYFFPVGDSKNLVVKDDSSLYRFQTPYYWASQNHSPDNIEYAIYLAKRSLRNKQKHALEDYEIEALNNMRKILQHKWDFVQMQADEQVRLAKERKKGDKIVTDSQERAYWRVYRPPPGYLNCLETAPIPSRTQSPRAKKKTVEDLQREAEFLQNCLVRTRLKVSQEVDNLIQNCETYVEYDPFITPVQPSNPWIGDDVNYWLLNSPLVEIPTDKRVRKWGLSMEHVVSDPTGLQEFTNYLRKEYSHENIRFWTAVNDLRHSAQSQIIRKVQHIFEEFLAPGAPCEINIDGKTMERVHQEMRNPSRFTFDSASEHVYTLLLKKDCYPRFVRSEHYKNLLATAIQPSQRRRFFNFGGQIKKKISTASAPNSLFQVNPQTMRRRGSDKSLTGSAHDLMGVIVRDTRVAHSHSQSNLTELECDIPYRDPPLKGHSSSTTFSETTSEKRDDDVCPWESFEIPTRVKKSEESQKKVSGQSNTSHGTTGSDVCPWEAAESPSSSKKHDNQKLSEAEATSETSEISEQLKKSSLQSNDSLLSKKISIDSAASGASIDVNVCPWENNDTPTPTRKYSTVVMESHQTVVDTNVHPPETESAPEETVISECTEESKKVPEQVTSSNTNTGVCVPLETSAIPEEVVCEETQVSMETSKITKGTSSKEEHVGESKKLSIAEKSDMEKVTAKDDKKSDSPKVHKTSCSSKHRKRSSLKPMSSVGSVDSNPGPSKECGKSVKAESSTTKVDTSVKSGYQTEATIPAEGPSEPRPTISPKKTTAVVPNWEETPTAKINEICPWEDDSLTPTWL